jgi:hypothetical protein
MQIELLALRHQLTVLWQKKRVGLGAADRFLCVVLSRFWEQSRSLLVIAKPETVIAWQRKGFRCIGAGGVEKGSGGRPVHLRER